MDFAKQGHPSTKVHHAPGGQSSFSLAWDSEPQKNVQKKPVVQQQNNIQPVNVPLQQNKNVQPQQNNIQPQQNKDNVQTSVKIHNPPGGKSNFTLGW